VKKLHDLLFLRAFEFVLLLVLEVVLDCVA